MTRSADDENFACTRGVIRSTRFGCRACARRRAGFGVGTPLPRGRVEAFCTSPDWESPRHGLLASARFGPSGMRLPWPTRASDARRSPCRTNREHRDGWSERFHAPRTPSPHLLRSRDLCFRFDCGSARHSLSRPRVASPHGDVSGETSHRSVASVFVITREHHLASRSTLAGSTPPSARCDASPFSASGSGGLTPHSPTGADPWMKASFRCARVCEQRPGCVRRTPRGRPCVAGGTEIPSTCAPACFAGAEPALARFSRCFRVARGRLLHLSVKSSPATRTHPVVPPREGSTPPGKSEVLSAAPRSGERALPVALPDGVGVGARGAFFTRADPGSDTTRLAQGPGARFASAIAWRIAALGAA